MVPGVAESRLRRHAPGSDQRGGTCCRIKRPSLAVLCASAGQRYARRGMRRVQSNFRSKSPGCGSSPLGMRRSSNGRRFGGAQGRRRRPARRACRFETTRSS
jgi:hypothetical protein